jgi:hypothetical protein
MKNILTEHGTNVITTHKSLTEMKVVEYSVHRVGIIFYIEPIDLVPKRIFISFTKYAYRLAGASIYWSCRQATAN